MHLKKIELIGFKSFADKTEVLFDKGVTCIVGPNGCGKSNISDAMRWVLGERSAKLLRGSKMEDVIFNGTEFRKPLAFAEVSLTIDNHDRGLPIDYQEVTLTRRYYRSGESEYLINRTQCRLMDIHNLIMDTGMGSNSYSMIEQGRIDYVLRADSDERRFLIEEAAGISKFKSKKEEAIRKLERTEANRLRLGDIVAEVQRNIQYAERQAKKAEKYKTEFEKLKDLEIRKAFFELNQIEKNQTEIDSKKLENNAALKQHELKLSELNEEQAKLKMILDGILEKFRKEDAVRFSIQAKMDQNTQQLNFNQEKRREIASRRGQISQENSQLLERIEKSKQEESAKETDIKSIEAQFADAQNTLGKAEASVAEIEIKLAQTQKNYENSKIQLFEAAQNTAGVRNEFNRLCAFLDTSNERKNKHTALENRLLSEQSQISEKIKVAERKIEESQTELSESNLKIRSFADQKDQIIAKLKDENASLAGCERQLYEVKTNLDFLLNVEAEQSKNEDQAVERLSVEDKASVNILKKAFDVTSGYEWAVDFILEEYAQSIIVDNPSRLKAILGQLMTGDRIAIGLMPNFSDLVFEESNDSENGFSPLLAHITPQIGYEAICKRLFSGIYIIDREINDVDIDFLLRSYPKSCFIHSSGVVLGPDYNVLIKRNVSDDENRRFTRQSKIHSFNAQLEQLTRDYDQCRTETVRWQKELELVQSSLDSLEIRRAELSMQKEMHESQLKGDRERFETLSRELHLIRLETAEMQEEELASTQRKETLSSKLKEDENTELGLRKTQDDILGLLQNLNEQKSQQTNILTQYRARFESLDEQKKLLSNSIQILSSQRGHDQARLKNIEHESLELDEKEKIILADDSHIIQNQEDLDTARRNSDIALEFIRQEKEKVEIDLGHVQGQISRVVKLRHEIENSIHQYEMQFLELNYKQKSIQERLFQTYKLNLNDYAGENYPLSDEDQIGLDERLEALRKRVESLGTVNLLAMEEYEELKQRYDFLIAQQQDLDQARDQLMETIRKINRTTKGLFERTFVEVQKYFQEYYETLFRGGQAKLVLLDEQNPLDSGVDIVVRPPGKKLQHISLLSGGEKALTAIALLFALFKIKPSPFCVLDEVDAPLDEANIDRFLTVLRTFLNSSQFIIVTHNRKTIAMGDSLYGVTMQDPGVSKLVSVKVQHDQKGQKLEEFIETDKVSEEPVANRESA